MWKLLGSLLLLLVEPILSRIIGALGLGFVSYVGLSALISSLKSAISSSLGGMTADMVQIMGMSGFGEVITMMLSAITIRAYLMGMNGAGSVVRSRWNRGG